MTNEELKKLANQNRELQEQLLSCQAQLEEAEEGQLGRTRRLREEMRDLHDKHKQQVVTLESTHKVSGGVKGQGSLILKYGEPLTLLY